MSFTFEITRPGVGLVSIEIRNPEFGDTTRFSRRQERGETEAGVLFLQDLGVDMEFYDATWQSLTRCERRDLEYFFGPSGTTYAQRPFTMGVENNVALAFPVGTGQGWSTADALASGSLVVPLSASFGMVKLEQSQIQFAATPRDRYTTSLRFRILQPVAC